MQDIHSGMCSRHAGYKSMVGKAFCHGFYWPTAVSDAQRIVRTCENCQFYTRQIHKPTQELQTIPITYPFAVWGLDILGPFPWAKGGYKFLFVAIDKFTKWIEAELVRKITAEAAIRFVRMLVSRFGVPNRIITDQGTQFTSKKFTAYCDDMGTRICLASVVHPQSNGRVEQANALVLQGIKKKSFE